MTTIINRPQTRGLLYPEVPGLGAQSVADSIDQTGITDAFILQDSNRGANSLRGRYLYRPNLVTDDRVKRSGVLSGAKLFQTGSAYASFGGGTDLNWELVGYMHPDELNRCIALAVKKLLWETRLPLSMYEDGDMDTAAATSYTPQDVNGTSTKVSTKDTEVWKGRYGLRFVAGGGGGPFYTETKTRRVTPGDELYNAAISRVAGAGTTAQFRLWDVTHNLEITPALAVSHSEQQWQHLSRVDTVPEGCYGVRLRLQVAEAAKTVYWNSLPAHSLSEFTYGAPSWLDDQFKLISFGEATYRQTPALGRDVAASQKLAEWYTPHDYLVEDFKGEAQADWLTIVRPKMPQHDLWIHGRRRYSDQNALTDEAGTIVVDEQELLAACKYEIACLLHDRYPNEKRWAEMVVVKREEVQAEKEARPPTPVQPEKKRYGGRWGGF